MKEYALILQSVYKPFSYPIWKSLKSHQLIIIQSIELHIRKGILPRSLIIESCNQSKTPITPLEIMISNVNGKEKAKFIVPDNLINCHQSNITLQVIPVLESKEKIEGILIFNYKEFPKNEGHLKTPPPKPSILFEMSQQNR